MTTYVVGHQNPDTDSICAAIAYANLKQQLGAKAEAIRAGKINAETEFILDKFEVQAPKLVTELAKGDEVILVDHNEKSQAIAGIKEAEVKEIIDHHRIGDIETGNPIYFRNEPVGSTATVVTKLYQENGVEINEQMAGLLLSAILSDTVIFRSPTCTKADKEIANRLAKQLGVDIQKYGKNMFKAGSVVNQLEPKELITNDYKEYELAGETIGVGQIEIMDVNEVNDIKEDLLVGIEELVAERGYKFLVLIVTDILAEGSLLLFPADAKEIIADAFDVDTKGTEVYLDGVLSRKKQVIPVLSDYLTT
ncbi:inorganic pyrophosphatase/exopolyphosphatase [Halobacteroides halobius DSM 5150]|uniref:inorganic diphosphatase n=1 Tax=Halobacteroides halobius (strain ATCC 35273 / DSM 5150 / MD-1) TaxID=748449 RepID=L0KA48_HALHC|nr:manganese-dependent inorganic pyrophosphatase [Halobacteroides halobius]AGB42182.1 inorganic pyrophosphatase/exopolyphosphatase [Halobacteroides halobius DSM 5150]